MDWLIGDKTANLTPWEARPFSAGVELGPQPGDAQDAHDRQVAEESPGPPLRNGPCRRLGVALRAFNVFPPNLVTGVMRRTIEAGDTVGVRYRFVPGLHMFFAARVTECFDARVGDLWRIGFTYRTLEGHPMCGEETFCVEKHLATGRVVVALRSWSRPTHWLTRFGGPFARRWQLQAGQSALDHLQTIAVGEVQSVVP